MKLTKNNNSSSVSTLSVQHSLRRDLLLCALIVFVSIFLHSLSRPSLYIHKDSREEYRTEDGLPYLSEMDSYLYCRLTEEIVDGETTISLRHSRGDDPYISANATGEEGDVVMGLPILGAAVYKLLSWIPGVTPYGVIYWLPAFIASLTAIPVFAFVRRRTNRLGGLVAAMLVVAAGPFSWYTHAGFYDTNMGLALLPCAFLLCLAEAMLAKSLRRQILWAEGSALSLCALSTFWRAYYAYFCIGAAAAFCAVAAVGVYRLVQQIRYRKSVAAADNSNISDSHNDSIDFNGSDSSDSSDNSVSFLRVLRGAAVGLGAQVLFCLLIRGKKFFRDLTEIFGNMGGSLANGDRAFPDAAIYVSELQPTPLLAENYGGKWYEKLYNGFVAYAEGCFNELGGWLVLAVTATVVTFLVYFCIKAVFFAKSSQRSAVVKSTADTPDDVTFADPSAATTPASSSVSMLRNPGDLLVTSVFLCVWLGCGFIIMLKGSRFLSIAVLPVGVLCGIGMGLFREWLKKTSSGARTAVYAAMILFGAAGCGFSFRAEFGWVAFAVSGAAALAIGVLLFFIHRPAVVNFFALMVILSPCMACAGGAYGATPDGSDTLQNMCDYINGNTEKDAILASWWDYGYFYEYAAKRLTLGDGGNFNSEWNYWLGQALMTNDEALAKGIFRMLGEGGLDALHLLMNAYTDGTAGVPHDPEYVLPDTLCNPPGYATTILKRILPLPQEEAKDILVSGYELPQATADELLALTHPAKTRPIYLILSEDMLRKIGAISDFGTWDFTKSSPAPLIARSISATKINLNTTGESKLSDAAERNELTAASGSNKLSDTATGFAQTYSIPLNSYKMSVRVTVSDAGFIRSVELVDDNSGRSYSSCCRIISDTARKDPLFSEGNIADQANSSRPTRAFDQAGLALPTFPSAGETYTVYLREDEPGMFRCIVCSTFAADSMIIRGMAADGDALFYRDIKEYKNNEGKAELHEVSVWNLGR